jgi:hypothetical protein
VFHAPLSKIQPFHIYPYFIICWIQIGLWNIEGPWVGSWNFQGTLLGVKCRHCIKQNVFCAPLSKIQSFHIYPYFISWIKIGLGNIEGPWLGVWDFKGTLLRERCPNCIKQNVFCTPLSKIQPFHIYPYFIISWINIRLVNIESLWLWSWNFQGAVLGARCLHCIKQNVFHAPLSKIQPFNTYPYFIISWIHIGLRNIEGPWIGSWNFQGTLFGTRCPNCMEQNVFAPHFLGYSFSIYTPIFLYLEKTSGL